MKIHVQYARTLCFQMYLLKAKVEQLVLVLYTNGILVRLTYFCPKQSYHTVLQVLFRCCLSVSMIKVHIELLLNEYYKILRLDLYFVGDKPPLDTNKCCFMW